MVAVQNISAAKIEILIMTATVARISDGEPRRGLCPTIARSCGLRYLGEADRSIVLPKTCGIDLGRPPRSSRQKARDDVAGFLAT
jgi:hypothetical protein